jgi:tight adherence protein B
MISNSSYLIPFLISFLLAFFLARVLRDNFTKILLFSEKIKSLKIFQLRKVEKWPRLLSAEPNFLEKLFGWARIDGFYFSIFILGIFILMILFLILKNFYFFILSLSIILISLLFLFQKYQNSRQKFLAQLPDALEAISQSLKSNLELNESFRLVADGSNAPIKNILESLVRAEEYKLDFEDSILRLKAQLDFPEWNLVVETFKITKETGGNVVPVLADLANSLRDQIKIDQEIKSITAAGRLSGYLIAVLAPLSLLFFWIFMPSYVNILFESTTGKSLIALAIFLEVLGFIIIDRIIAIDF